MLFSTRITRMAMNQKCYLIQISISELLICVCKIVHRILTLHGFLETSFKIWTFQTSGCFMAYIIFMILLTVDRFFEVYLNIKYSLYWTWKMTKITILVGWLISCIFAVVMCAQTNEKSVRAQIILFFWPTSELAFLLVAIIVYVYLFQKIRRNRKSRPTISTVHNVSSAGPTKTTGTGPQSLAKGRRKRLYLPTLLVATFILLWIIPDQTEFIFIMRKHPPPPYFAFLINVLITCALCSDAVIYIFGIVEIKRRILKASPWRKSIRISAIS
eukprot:TCONS_00053198-protein